jgi:hypothetical protein
LIHHSIVVEFLLDQEELLGKKLKRIKEKTIEVNRKGLKYNEDNSLSGIKLFLGRKL